MRILLLGIISLTLVSCSIFASARLEQDVVKALAEDSRTSQYTFEVADQGEGKVYITGEVSSGADIDTVTEIAKAVAGVTTVINKCHVEEASSGLMQDEVVPSPFL